MSDYEKSRTYRRRPLRRSGAPAPATFDNDVWAIDGKGLWRGVSPLSVLDVNSRYLLALENVHVVTHNVQRVMGRLFDDHGQPRRIRCDGGTPFGGSGLAQLSKLALWWIDLGITVEHVAKPQHNGHLERLHRTLEQEGSSSLAVDVALREFRQTYNELRPHAQLAGRAPAECYAPHDVDPRPEFVARYDDERSVTRDGYFKWHGERVYVGEALVTRKINFRVLEEELWLVRYRHMPLALFNEHSMKLHRVPRDTFERFT